MPRAGSPPAGWGMARLALALALAGSLGGGQHYDYYGWQPESLSHGRFYGREPQCLDIPPDMQLCHDVGYKRMRLPNLLEHETMAEAKQQASSWVPLLAKQCHTDTQLFLCSLFAPVCLDRPVYPCRSLCEVVRDSCAPVMESYGFPWPEMLHCGKFPSDHELCIAVQFGNSKATPPPVVKMRIKEMTEENGERRLVAAQKKKVLKLGPLKRKDTKKMVLYMRNASTCPCPQLDSLSGSFLVMGRKVGGRLLLLAVYPWQKHNKEMKFAVKFMFSYPCPLYHPLLYGAGQH
ncbi:secreted frizzled-related protein 5 isoform X2 [Phalacrocorax carbo]|uniref:secreted frizzled-related protein 5 isoform X2 n=1 Tax=Phalacrocorax carbo TaxID=9209 RepID=UPI003119C63E